MFVILQKEDLVEINKNKQLLFVYASNGVTVAENMSYDQIQTTIKNLVLEDKDFCVIDGKILKGFGDKFNVASLLNTRTATNNNEKSVDQEINEYKRLLSRNYE